MGTPTSTTSAVKPTAQFTKTEIKKGQESVTKEKLNEEPKPSIENKAAVDKSQESIKSAESQKVTEITQQEPVKEEKGNKEMAEEKSKVDSAMTETLEGATPVDTSETKEDSG